ncbi:MAG: hypothetical protein IT393_02400 [Nitrospirae bacterium]|nr:hypothetical protein [Nitrospirota bacterium]
MKITRAVALSVLIAFASFIFAPSDARSEENGMRTIFMDTFYGMAAGALIASAVSLTQDDPDWGGNVGTGAAIGGIAGAIFGVASEVRYVATVNKGSLTVSLPSVSVVADNKTGGQPLYTAGIFKYKF